MSWKDELPDELRESPALKDVTDVGSLAKQFVDLQAHMGNKMNAPKQDWTDAEWADWTEKVIEKAGGRVVHKPDLTSEEQSEQFFRSIGKPETPEGYTAPEDLDLTAVTPEQLQQLKNRLHTANLTDKQFHQMARHLVNEVKAQKESQTNESKNILDRLDLEWGQNRDLKKLALVDRLRSLNAPTELVDQLNNNLVNADNTLFLDRLVSQLGGEANPVSGDPVGPGIRTPSAIDAEIARLNERKAALPDDAAGRAEIRRIVDKQFALRQERDKLQ